MTIERSPGGTGIKQLGWRQGSILSSALAAHLRDGSNTDQEILVVVSHDCDVTSASLENEPLVELLVARVIPDSQRNGGLLYGKNPRRIQFPVKIGDNNQFAEACAHERLFVRRDQLLGCGPDQRRTCDALAVVQISDWLSRRYVRSAFPDTFNDRIRSAQKVMKKILKDHGQDITGVFVAANSWRELPDDEPYRVSVVALMTEEYFTDADRRQRVQKQMDRIEQRLQECHGIDAECLVAGEGDVTVAEFRKLRRLDFDYLSLRDEDGVSAPRP